MAAAMTAPAPSMSMAATATAMAAGTLPIDHAHTMTVPTPMSATYPASLHSPLPSATFQIKREEASLKTPLTPPSAYMDFLKALSPAHSRGFASPLSTGASATFSFPSLKSPNWQAASDRLRTSIRSIPANYPYPQAPATARPALSTTSSHSSSDSIHTTTSAPESTVANSGRPVTRPTPPVNLQSQRANSTGQIPTQKRRAASAHRPSLVIPESPSTGSFSANVAAGPATAGSPSGGHGAPWSSVSAPAETSGWSPVDWETFAQRTPGNTRPVSVRHVVTRTVTYHRPIYSGRGIKRAAGDSATGPVDARAPKVARVQFSEGVKMEDVEEEQEDMTDGDDSTDDSDGDLESASVGSSDKAEQDTAAGATPMSAQDSVSKPVVKNEEATRQSPRRLQPQRGFVKPLVGDAPKGRRRKTDDQLQK